MGRCFIRIFDKSIDEGKAEDILEDVKEKIYSKPFFGGDHQVRVPKRTNFSIGRWKGNLQLEINGIGTDGRCELCKYFRKKVGLDKTKRYNCPFTG